MDKLIIIKEFAVKFDFEPFKAIAGVGGLEIKNPPFQYSAKLANGSALPDYFIFNTKIAEATVLPSPYAKGRWQIMIYGELPIIGK